MHDMGRWTYRSRNVRWMCAECELNVHRMCSLFHISVDYKQCPDTASLVAQLKGATGGAGIDMWDCVSCAISYSYIVLLFMLMHFQVLWQCWHFALWGCFRNFEVTKDYKKHVYMCVLELGDESQCVAASRSTTRSSTRESTSIPWKWSIPSRYVAFLWLRLKLLLLVALLLSLQFPYQYLWN